MSDAVSSKTIPLRERVAEKQNPGRRKQSNVLPKILLIILMICAFFVLAYYLRQEDEYAKMKIKTGQNEAVLQALQDANDELDVKMKQIDDPAYIGEVARSQLGMLKEGEKIFRDGSGK